MKHISLLFTALLSFSNLAGQNEAWRNLDTTSIHREEARTIAIPHASELDARTKSMEESTYYLSLNGTWKFHWVADPANRPVDFYQPAYPVGDWEDIKVPASWQIEAVRNNKPWDKPLYSNIKYPFTTNVNAWTSSAPLFVLRHAQSRRKLPESIYPSARMERPRRIHPFQ